MPDSTWDRIKAIPKALDAAAGKGTSTPASGPRPAAPSWPANTVIHQPPLGQKDTNLPLEGSVYDQSANRSPSSGVRKTSARRTLSRPLTRRA